MNDLKNATPDSPFQLWQKRFEAITENSLWCAYLRWAYAKCVEDFTVWGRPVDFKAKDFTALLCGTAGATTSKEFISFILNRNPMAKMIILDIGFMQIETTKTMIDKEFKHANILCIQADARVMPLPDNSIDLIETDGVFEFMNGQDVQSVLIHWHRILKASGKCMFRDFAPRYRSTRGVNLIKKNVAKFFFKLKLYNHTWSEFHQMFERAKFSCYSGGSAFLPSFRRFTLEKNP